MVYDFHTQTTLSDGDLSPIKQIRRAVVNGYGFLVNSDAHDQEHLLTEEFARAVALGAG